LAFTEPLILARNLIVHNGGEADQEAPDGSKDQEFPNRYPDWVIISTEWLFPSGG